ncbi:2-oxo-4-hydroxy-4-carboxy-5-ureidoimidazoline decarboxylase [Frigoribacterium sp. VKM Ac-2530]|uniref:2-oxo-4-hydroxy-4-carboxy-5-ureidoimidazoline decarboxylase n=1 Tax=Frigoribacterium sp. VKM Ac-2530 TaxID=2783822 RepID=UPI00188C591A|nr:2-oxo-4-hydroxy-4-carboxy-5-ureidoimidazoline decarboxylase [Frigoribacterium sp. VKM Ac-2530]MBF4580139.1 OHCU decarboxylase [Frigoribacterium sp. VKM Ac-2530]
MIDVPEGELRERLATALSVPRWVDEVAGQAPFDDVDALIAVARRAGSLTSAEVDQALEQHDLVAEPATGDAGADEYGRREERASHETDDPQLVKALAEGGAVYEERFGRAFVIRTAGRSRDEVVAELDRRLRLDDEAEKQEVGAQLVEIAVVRLRQVFASRTAETGRGTETASPVRPLA